MSLSGKGFVLRAFKHAESDLIVHTLSSEGRKLKLFARSALKSRKRFGGGVLEPTHYISFQCREGTEEKLGQLVEANLLEGFEALRQSYDKVQLALHFVGLIDRLGLEGAQDGRPLFDLLGNALTGLCVARDLVALRTQFELKLLHCQGVLPTIEGAEELLKRSIRSPQEHTMEPQLARRLQLEADQLLRQYVGHFG